MVFLPPFRRTNHGDRSINLALKIKDLHHFLLDRGMLYLYALFIAGYFLLPMASGHRRLFYILVLPAILLLARELREFYRDNRLAGLILIYAAYMMTTLLWSADFAAEEALWTLRNTTALLCFVFVSGYLWIRHDQQIDILAFRSLALASALALLSIIVWYSSNPFPTSRLEPLGVMHHQNKAACAYGLFFALAVYHLISGKHTAYRNALLAAAVVLLCLIVFTQSRTALAGISVALIVLLGRRALGVILVGLVASFVLVAGNPEDWWSRVQTLSFRPGIWQQLLADMPGHWLFGRGYLLDPHVGAYGHVFNHAHNSYLATLRDGGIIGLGLLLLILAVALYQAWHLLNQRGERLYLALLLYGMTCVTMDFDRLFVHPKELWLFFWLPIALTMAAYAYRRDQAQPRYAITSTGAPA